MPSSSATPVLSSMLLKTSSELEVVDYIVENSEFVCMPTLRNLRFRLVTPNNDMYRYSPFYCLYIIVFIHIILLLHRYTEDDINTSRLNGFPPFWGFIWPGGYGLSRYIQENEELFQRSTLIDFGCGCGSATIAAHQAGCNVIIFNDIDPRAIIATALNHNANINKDISRNNFVSSENYLLKSMNDIQAITSQCESDANTTPSLYISSIVTNTELNGKNVQNSSSNNNSNNKRILLVGDMMYDDDIGLAVLSMINGLVHEGWTVYVGDPGRAFAVKHLLHSHSSISNEVLAQYELPLDIKSQNNGLSSVSVRRLSKF